MTNVYPFERQNRARDPRSLQFKIEAYQRLLRDYSPHLKAHEFIVLMQVLDRTVGWAELEASFTLTALRKGDDVYGGIAKAVSERTMFRALASLEAKGILQCRHDPRKFDKRHYRVNLDWRPDMLVTLPKVLKEKPGDPCHSVSTPCHADSDPCHSGSLYTGSPRQVIETGSHDGPASRAVAIDPGKEIRKKGSGPAVRVRARHEGAAPVHRQEVAPEVVRRRSKTTADSVEQVWRAAVAETFPGHPVPFWTVREKGQAKTALKKWRQPGVSFHDFMEWCARNWTAIMSKQFSWMTKQAPPAVPALPFLFSFMDGFVECYAENKLEAWLTSRDRTEIERLMSRGNTYEQAMATLAERKAATALRDEMEKREAEVRLQANVARVRLQKAEKLMDLGAAPPHPRSRAAERIREEARRAAPPPPITIRGVDEDFPEVMVPFVDPDTNPFA